MCIKDTIFEVWKGYVYMKQQHLEKNDAQKSKKATSTSVQEPVPAENVSLKQGEPHAAANKDEQASRLAATSGLAVIIGQLVAYFHDRADIDDLDVLSFSLHHLFCRVDFLYRNALPVLAELTTGIQGKAKEKLHIRQRQPVWSQLQSINRTLDRMEPLCHLLSDATECILDSLDTTSEIFAVEPNGVDTQAAQHSAEQSLLAIDQERWDQSFHAVTQSLLNWQGHQRVLPAFAAQFTGTLPTVSGLVELDAAFATILDCAGAIFGDILPSFRAILVGDDTAVAAHLFDLMQQSDQLLVQFDTTLAPMNTLIKHYAINND